MKRSVASVLYTLAWRLALPAVLLRMWWRGRREPRYRHAVGLRLGLWNAGLPSKPRVWLHAVSLGETRAAEPLVQALRAARPDLQLVLTAGTATGWDAGTALLAPGDLQGWLPLDTPGATARFFRRVRPDLGILMETETWPNLIEQAERAGVPLVLANARLSERSLAKARRNAWLTQPMMQRLSAVLAQSVQDAQRLEAAGARAAVTTVVGHMKYDMKPEPALIARGRGWREAVQAEVPGRRVVMAASWREGEDPALLDAWIELKATVQPSPLLLLVPRHPQRFHAVQEAVQARGLQVMRRSRSEAADLRQADVWLGDSLGEMAAYYAAADVALLGGSFAPLGGQNLIEAAACGCPLIMGPHTFNFAQAAQSALDEGAAWLQPDARAAVHRALHASDAELSEARRCAGQFAARHGGATERTVQALLAWLPPQGPSSGAKA